MSFAGRGIVLTRPRELGTAFAKEIEARGARAIVFPTIEIQPLPAPAVLRNLGAFDFVVFVSPSAVRVAQTMLPPWPPAARAVAISFGTKRELDRAGIAPVIVPQAGADSEAVLARARSELGDAAFEAAWAEGQALAPDDALGAALEALSG